MEVMVKILDKNERVIYSNIEEKYSSLVSMATKESMVIEDSGRKLRVGVIRTPNGTVFALSKAKDAIKSSRAFVSQITLAANSLGFIGEIQSEIEIKVNSDTARLLHNLTSLNAHNIQEIYSLVPQESLANKADGHVEIVEEIVKKNTRACALALLRIAKNNAAIKTEFSVFKRLFNSSPQLQERTHVFHKVLMNILYLFFSEFTDKSVSVKVQSSQLTGYFDYESMHVALYHIIENAVKYVLPKSELSIGIKEDGAYLRISFDMISTQIKEGEVTRIYEEGFSGSIPNITGKAGAGIGMSRVSRIVSLNGGKASVNVYPETLREHMGIPYQRNEFIISVRREKPKHA